MILRIIKLFRLITEFYLFIFPILLIQKRVLNNDESPLEKTLIVLGFYTSFYFLRKLFIGLEKSFTSNE